MGRIVIDVSNVGVPFGPRKGRMFPLVRPTDPGIEAVGQYLADIIAARASMPPKPTIEDMAEYCFAKHKARLRWEFGRFGDLDFSDLGYEIDHENERIDLTGTLIVIMRTPPEHITINVQVAP